MAQQGLVRLANVVDASLMPTLSYKVIETSISGDIVVQKVEVSSDMYALITYMEYKPEEQASGVEAPEGLTVEMPSASQTPQDGS